MDDHSTNADIIVGVIKKLAELRSKLINNKSAPQIWPKHFLQHAVIKKFVIWVVEKVHAWISKEQNHRWKESMDLLRKIVTPVDLDILDSSEAPFTHKMHSLYHKNTSDCMISLTDHHIIELLSIIEDLINNHLLNIGSACNDTGTLTCISQYVEVYRNYMKKTEQIYETLLLETLMLALNYDARSNKFGAFCKAELKRFHAHKNEIVEYFEKAKGNFKMTEEPLKLQVFLFELAVAIGMKYCYGSTACIKKELILKHIEYMKQQLSPSYLLPQIKDVLNAFESDYENLMQYLSIVKKGTKWNSKQSLHIALRTHLNISAKGKTIHLHDKDEPYPLESTLKTILNTLKLTEKYPQKLSLKDALMIKPEIVILNNEDISKLPYVILHKIMTCDCKSRSYLCPTNTLMDTHGSTDSLNGPDNATVVHPVDAILALLHCSDNFLRQVLLHKLSLCQIAIPLLLPDTTKRTITLLLWAMHSVKKTWEVIDSSSGKHILKQCSIVEYEGPIISFVRYGRLTHSKSEILNKVIGTEDIFFHWDLETEESEKVINDGVLDICCYSPSSDNAHFSDSMIFTNLHGDANEHLTQITFVKKISFISVILISKEFIRDTNEDSINTLLQDFALLPGGSIILIDSKKLYEKKIIKDLIKSDNLSAICIGKKRLAKIKDEIIISINKKLKIKHTFKSIASYVDVAHELNICIDEEDEDCTKGKFRALSVMEHAKDNMSKSKYNILPLQGPNFWHKWVTCNNEIYNHKNKSLKTSTKEYIQQKEKEKVELRADQLNSEYSSFTHEFLSNVLHSKESEQIYFLHWMKIYLSNTLPEFQQQYKQICSELSSVKSADNDKKNELKDRLKQLNSMQFDVSFGLEHCFRELGQLFEAIKETEDFILQDLRSCIYLLPQLAAKALIEGFPIEIMDGEALHIPITWVQAIINCLEKHYADKKLFVFSILGVQSSGKSTLLNTMFGLHFNVSAGRCTRGAFIQLLEVDESLKYELHCDFILVVDTEGICAPELLNIDSEEQHDNKLATFVVGLADITIINIYGEAPSNLSNILQIVLHAFIRMKEVEKHPKCIFVHQNVPDRHAGKNTSKGVHALLAMLDKATEMVAAAEECESKYTKFQDVINFDKDSDMHYFKGLWKGNPPMAPINPGYSEDANKLKKALLTVVSKQRYFCSFKTFKHRIINMWDAILKERFLFSFKNVKEFYAYNILDEKLGKLNLQLQEKAESKLSECKRELINSVAKDIGNVKNKCITNSKKELDETYKKLTEELHEFIENHEYSSILSRWAYFIELKLREFKDHHYDMIQKFCKSKVCEREKNKEKENKLLKYEEKIDKEIIELAEKHIDLSTQELEEIFNLNWKMWMDGCKTNDGLDYVTDDMINSTIENVFTSKFKKEHDVLAEATKLSIISSGDDALEPFKGDQNKHINFRTEFLTFNVSYQEVENRLNQLSQMRITEAAAKIHEDLEAFNNYSFAIIDSALTSLISSIDEFNQNVLQNHFTLTSKYKLDLALYICKKAIIEIKEWIRCKNNPGLVVSLEHQKSRFFLMFQNKCNSSISIEKGAATQICDSLIEIITNAVCNTMEVKIVRDLSKRSFDGSKMNFKVQVLTDLTNESFNLYREYFDDCNESFKNWGEKYIIRYSQSKSETTSEEVFTQLANEEIGTLVTVIRKATLRPANCSNQEWVDEFCFALEGMLEIKKSQWIKDVNPIDNLEKFKTHLTQELNKLLETKTILENIKKEDSRIFKNAGKKLYNSIIGNTCTAQCPFCEEQCDLINSSHLQQNIPHYVKVHRPQCTAKSDKCMWKKDETNMVDHCNILVASDLTLDYFLKSPKGRMQYKPKTKTLHFSKYQRVYKDWEISEKVPSLSDYWKWVMINFHEDILQWAGRLNSEVKIPDLWKDISKEKAINSLEAMLVFSQMHPIDI